MNNPLKLLAFDFGASSGRGILGRFDGQRLSTQELHRFSNDPVSVRGHIQWDVLRLFHEIKQGLLKCSGSEHRGISSIAVDTWGVDFGLLDAGGNLLSNPYHYRDSLTDNITEEAFKLLPEDELYRATGLQFMKFNTIFQLYAMKYYDMPLLREAKTMLMMSDLFNYFLTGIKTTEYSIASTSQLLDPQKKEWCGSIISRLQLPSGIFPDIVKPGTILDNLSADISEECGIPSIPVIATASHDTACAVAAVPAQDGDFAYISCGTWSLMGIESDRPVINAQSHALSYANEGGVGGKIRFLKMIMGLWLIQECKKQWEREGYSFSFAELEAMALEELPFKAFIDPDDQSFMAPGNMPKRIACYCRETGQSVPEAPGEIMRCIYQSLALKYRKTLEELETITGKKLPVIHMVGGGIKDSTLCRFTAGATGRAVYAGPVEATSSGNLLVQAMALGEISNLSEIRQVVKDSFNIEVFVPGDTGQWDEAYHKLKNIIKTVKRGG